MHSVTSSHTFDMLNITPLSARQATLRARIHYMAVDRAHTLAYPAQMDNNVIDHPTSANARTDRDKARENLARQLRTNQMMRESARERINAGQIIDQIGEIDAQLMGSATLATKEVIDPTTNEKTIVTYEVPIPMEREVISALKARADIKFKLLGKVLPDLKATESVSHSTHDHQHAHLHAPVSSVEMATRIQLWQQQVAKTRPPKVIEGEVEEPQLSEEYDWL